MDSYIVRIYRRTGEPPELAGQIEKAGTEMKKYFHNSGELVKILMGGCDSCGNHISTSVTTGILQNRR